MTKKLLIPVLYKFSLYHVFRYHIDGCLEDNREDY